MCFSKKRKSAQGRDLGGWKILAEQKWADEAIADFSANICMTFEEQCAEQDSHYKSGQEWTEQEWFDWQEENKEKKRTKKQPKDTRRRSRNGKRARTPNRSGIEKTYRSKDEQEQDEAAMQAVEEYATEALHQAIADQSSIATQKKERRPSCS